MKKILVTSLVVSTVFTSAALAGEQYYEDQGEHFGKGRMGPAKIYRKLDLTDEQKKQITTIFEQVKSPKHHDEAMKAERKAERAKRRALIETGRF